MDGSGEGSPYLPEEEDLTCPGPLIRVKVMVLGNSQCGKTSLVRCLLQGTPQSCKPDYTPTEGVSVDLWTPFSTQHGLQRLLSHKLTGEEHRLVLELWDTSGRQVCHPVYGLFLTAKTVCIIVYDVTDDGAEETVLALYHMVQQKYRDSAVIVVGNKADLGGPLCDVYNTSHRLNTALLQQTQVYTQHISQELEDVRALLREMQEAGDRDNDPSIHRPPAAGGKKDNRLLRQSTEDRAEQRLLHQHMAHLEQRLAARASRPSPVHCVTVSAFSCKGLDEFRKMLLDTALTTASFPHCSNSAVKASTVGLYDHVLAMRERDLAMLPWQQFQEMIAEAEKELTETGFEEDMAYLEAVGGIAEFRVGHVSFPSLGCNLQHQGNSDKAAERSKACPTEAIKATQKDICSEDRYICLHPALFATAICHCLIDDDKKSFRFEAGRFWPKDSGFKHPDPQMLCKVLEAIPQLGLLRECVLPLIWQEYSLEEDQVLNMLHVLQGLGLLAHHCDQKKHCEGLALPDFTRLSVHRCHALILLGLLPDNRPQLNWTAKPFVGDIQVTWSFQTRAHTGLLQQLQGAVLFLSRECSNYRHLWRHGVLLRVGEATVCAEQRGDERFDVACRVNGDELGREPDAMRMLWVTLAPFVMHVRSFLLRWPGLHFKETILALGQQFYLDEKIDQEPELWVPAALSLWQRRKYMAFKEGDNEHELDINLLFPFKHTSVSSVEDWLKLVISKTDVILSDASVDMVSFLPPLNQEKALKRQSMRGSVRCQKKKKSVEVKFQLQEENNNNELSTEPPPTAGSDDSLSKATGKDVDRQMTVNTSMDSENRSQKDEEGKEGKAQPEGRVLSAQDEHAETLRLASAFVAAILASAMADYVAQEAKVDQDGRKMVSTAQIAAARVTAEAALAVQVGDIEGAAKAVIDAVHAVSSGSSSSAMSDGRKRRGSVQSKLCAIV